MPQTCTICRNPHREAVDAALVAGESLRSIAKRFGTSQSAVFRHRKNDLSPALVHANQERKAEHTESLIEQVQALVAEARAILAKAENQRTALVAVRELRGTLELLARLTGQLQVPVERDTHRPIFMLPDDSRVQVNIGVSHLPEIDVSHGFRHFPAGSS